MKKIIFLIGIVTLIFISGCKQEVIEPKTLYFSDHSLEKYMLMKNEEVKSFYTVTNPSLDMKEVIIEVQQNIPNCIENNKMYNFSFNQKFKLSHNVSPIADKHFYLDFKTTNQTVSNCQFIVSLYDGDKLADSYSEIFDIKEIDCERCLKICN